MHMFHYQYNQCSSHRKSIAECAWMDLILLLFPLLIVYRRKAQKFKHKSKSESAEKSYKCESQSYPSQHQIIQLNHPFSSITQ